VHTALIILLLFLGFSTPLPLPGEEGVEVSLGLDSQGSGDIQPEEPVTFSGGSLSENIQADDSPEVLTQDTEDAPAITESNDQPEEPVVKENKTETQKTDKEPEINPAALYKGKSQTSDKQQGEGTTSTPGDQGSPFGSDNSKNYSGKGGTDNGLSYSLAGRSPKYLPKPTGTFRESGTVVVQITVDRFGKVIKAVAIDKGSNTTNTTLRRLAEEAALQAVFNASSNAAEIQRGTITYHFVIKN
jgi:TonB family protein